MFNTESKNTVMHKLQETNPESVSVVNLIRVVVRVGDGSPENEVRFVAHYYSMDGKKVATSSDSAQPEDD